MVVFNFDHRFLCLKYGTPFDSLVNHWLPRSRKPDNVGGKCWFHCHVFVLLVYKNITMFWWKKTSFFAGYMNTNSMNMIVYYRSCFFQLAGQNPDSNGQCNSRWNALVLHPTYPTWRSYYVRPIQPSYTGWWWLEPWNFVTFQKVGNGIIIPTDFHSIIFSEGLGSTTNQYKLINLTSPTNKSVFFVV